MQRITIDELLRGKRDAVNLSNAYERSLDNDAKLAGNYRHDKRHPQSGQFVPAKQPASKPASLKDPADGRVLMVKQGGRWCTMISILMKYGIPIPPEHRNDSVFTMVPLTGEQVQKILQKASDQFPGDGDSSGSSTPSAFKSSQKEGRESATGPRSGFGVKMKTAKGGGLVEASNPPRTFAWGEDDVTVTRPSVSLAAPSSVSLDTPIESDSPWLEVGDLPSDLATFQALRDAVRIANPF